MVVWVVVEVFVEDEVLMEVVVEVEALVVVEEGLVEVLPEDVEVREEDEVVVVVVVVAGSLDDWEQPRSKDPSNKLQDNKQKINGKDPNRCFMVFLSSLCYIILQTLKSASIDLTYWAC